MKSMIATFIAAQQTSQVAFERHDWAVSAIEDRDTIGVIEEGAGDV